MCAKEWVRILLTPAYIHSICAQSILSLANACIGCSHCSMHQLSLYSILPSILLAKYTLTVSRTLANACIDSPDLARWLPSSSSRPQLSTLKAGVQIGTYLG